MSFLRTLQFNPRIALFDETTSALDDKTVNLLIRLVLDWHDDHKALIWVTHKPSEQQALGANLWRMENGVLAV
ncbi:ATP-binding cassette domain-containing protein [Moraxella bovoculi]|uniref:ATP-binding cassette domain-containing protein n=1 Tax=Moraxella bovoculi TaxID=386891 RepID=UPI003F505B91